MQQMVGWRLCMPCLFCLFVLCVCAFTFFLDESSSKNVVETHTTKFAKTYINQSANQTSKPHHPRIASALKKGKAQVIFEFFLTQVCELVGMLRTTDGKSPFFPARCIICCCVHLGRGRIVPSRRHRNTQQKKNAGSKMCAAQKKATKLAGRSPNATITAAATIAQL